jgi:hypothetical protein
VFWAENSKFISRYFRDDKKHFVALTKEILDVKSDKTLVSNRRLYGSPLILRNI